MSFISLQYFLVSVLSFFQTMEDFEMFEKSQMFEHNTHINLMSESSREQNMDFTFILETSRVSHGKAFAIIEDETLCRS